MANFWRSFYQGWDAGDKMYQRAEELGRRRDIADASKEDQTVGTQYDPEQLAKLQDPLEQAGGQWDEQTQTYKMGDGNNYTPRQAPTFENGGYTLPDGSRVAPRSTYTLGGQTRNTPFSQDEIGDARLNRMASVYEKYGDPEKAMNLRANAQTAKLGKVQYENALREADQAKNGAKILKLQQQYSSGAITPEEFMKNLIDATDPINGDGVTHAYEDMGDGNYYISQFKDNKYVGSKVASPEDAFREALRYSSPTMYTTIFGQDMQKAGLKLKQDEFGETQNQNTIMNGLRRDQLGENKRQFDEGMSYKVAEHNDEMGLKSNQQRILENYYNQVGSRQSYLNPLQQYQLDQQMKFDTTKAEILSRVDRGELTEKQADQQLNRLHLKFGSGSLREARDTFKNPKEAAEFAASMYGEAEWAKMPMSRRQEIVDDYMGKTGQGMGMPDMMPPPPDPRQPAPAVKPKAGLAPPRPAPQAQPVVMAPKELPMGGERNWYDRGLTPSTIGQALPWAQNDLIR